MEPARVYNDVITDGGGDRSNSEDYSYINPTFETTYENSGDGDHEDLSAEHHQNPPRGPHKQTPLSTDTARSDLTLQMPDDKDVYSDNVKDDGSWFVRKVTSCQLVVNTFWTQFGLHIKTTALSILCVLYAAYFGYALYYEFGNDEQSIRLLWVTCAVVVCLALSLLWTALSGYFEGFSESSVVESARKNYRTINWIILAVLYSFIVIFVIVDITVETQNYYNFVSFAGIFVYLLLLFIFSFSPSRVNWQTVLWGISLQFIFAMIVLRWPAGYDAFRWLGDRVTEFLAYANAGAEFVFGANYKDHMFAFQVLPVVIFFSSVVSILFYWGVMQFIILKLAWVMQATMQTTAAESINAAGNIFIGQTEAPLMIRPFLEDMTRSEIHAVMTGGFATIAGAVMAAYILFGVPANHLLSASVMSAPAALAVSKLFYPETEKSRTTAEDVKKLSKSPEVNVLEAASNGASTAVSLAANIAANLIAFIALLEFINTTLTWFGQRVGVEELTFQIICSYVLWPLAAVMGVTPDDCRKVAQMIGTKTFLNEFVAYQELSVFINNRVLFDDHVAVNGSWFYRGDDIILTHATANDTILDNGIMTERSELISTYALCGFSNFSSIGIQIGALSAMAPSRRNDLASVALRAMIAGNIACFMTACIAGLFFQAA